MIMIRAIVRPEKADEVMAELAHAGFPAVTKIDVFGRGKQRGIRAGDVSYDELPKVLLLIVIEDKEKNQVIKTILKTARTGETGNFGDGKIFVSPVVESYRISTGSATL
jgi:nitrogen regulatory protein PII 1